jgi:hypothetical protein
VLVERAARARVLGLGKLAQRSDRWRIEVELRVLGHPGDPTGFLDPYRINAYALAQFAATRADRSGDIKKSLYRRCRRRRPLL